MKLTEEFLDDLVDLIEKTADYRVDASLGRDSQFSYVTASDAQLEFLKKYGEGE